MIMEVLIAH